MFTIQKANSQLKINENELDFYLAQGYSQVDNETGELIKAGQATELKDIKAENETLKVKYSELLKANEAFKTENETLQAENADLKAQLEAANKKSK